MTTPSAYCDFPREKHAATAKLPEHDNALYKKAISIPVEVTRWCQEVLERINDPAARTNLLDSRDDTRLQKDAAEQAGAVEAITGWRIPFRQSIIEGVKASDRGQ